MPPAWLMVTTTVPQGGATTVTVWLHGALVLPQQSVACHFRVIRLVHPDPVALVKVLIRVMVTLVPQQASYAVGGVKLHGVPQMTPTPEAQATSGGVVSTTVTVWLQVLVLPQQSLASHVRVILSPQSWPGRTFVTVFSTVM